MKAPEESKKVVARICIPNGINVPWKTRVSLNKALTGYRRRIYPLHVCGMSPPSCSYYGEDLKYSIEKPCGDVVKKLLQLSKFRIQMASHDVALVNAVIEIKQEIRYIAVSKI
ncbi:hypothetical protein PR048_028274 [Dryococelus australis]|uniref:Uncharacterized protein n=1 Tax=Dryococelus australis TaxID=614101 RepID=A0ABQ9GIT7_9NEOP|nr:hypothetical protein PR048_028274 [Dryococelus australis]